MRKTAAITLTDNASSFLLLDPSTKNESLTQYMSQKFEEACYDLRL